jgi:hypothetical protein
VESSGDHGSSLASLPVSIKAGRVYDVVSNFEMRCRQNEMRGARQIGGRSTTAVPEMASSPGDPAGVDTGLAVALYPAPDAQLSDLSLDAEPATSNAVPSHNHDLLDLTFGVVAASENIS